eukprot:13350729-Alexandrium_andersonii.AAC.1
MPCADHKWRTRAPLARRKASLRWCALWPAWQPTSTVNWQSLQPQEGGGAGPESRPLETARLARRGARRASAGEGVGGR